MLKPHIFKVDFVGVAVRRWDCTRQPLKDILIRGYERGTSCQELMNRLYFSGMTNDAVWMTLRDHVKLGVLTILFAVARDHILSRSELFEKQLRYVCTI